MKVVTNICVLHLRLILDDVEQGKQGTWECKMSNLKSSKGYIRLTVVDGTKCFAAAWREFNI